MRRHWKLVNEYRVRRTPIACIPRNNSPNCYYMLGQYQEAKQRYEKTLNIRKRISGEENPDTLRSAHALACCYYMLDQYQEAKQLHETTLNIRKRISGEEDPDSLISAHQLANCYYMLGQYQEAKQLHEKTLNIRKRI
jgi:tetratricopeptide (TPR) repeat protein